MSDQVNTTITVNNDDAPQEVAVLFSVDNHIPTPVTVNLDEVVNWEDLNRIMEANGIAFSADLKYRLTTFDVEGNIDTIDVDLSNVSAPIYSRGGVLKNVNVYGNTTKQGNGADIDLTTLDKETIANLGRSELFKIVKSIKVTHNINFDELTGENHTRTTSGNIRKFLQEQIPALVAPDAVSVEDTSVDTVVKTPTGEAPSEEIHVWVDSMPEIKTMEAPRPSGVPSEEIVLPVPSNSDIPAAFMEYFHKFNSINGQLHSQVAELKQQLADRDHNLAVQLSDISMNLQIIREKV